jgi:hypothetical protein
MLTTPCSNVEFGIVAAVWHLAPARSQQFSGHARARFLNPCCPRAREAAAMQLVWPSTFSPAWLQRPLGVSFSACWKSLYSCARRSSARDMTPLAPGGLARACSRSHTHARTARRGPRKVASTVSHRSRHLLCAWDGLEAILLEVGEEHRCKTWPAHTISSLSVPSLLSPSLLLGAKHANRHLEQTGEQQTPRESPPNRGSEAQASSTHPHQPTVSFRLDHLDMCALEIVLLIYISGFVPHVLVLRWFFFGVSF